MEYLTIFIIKIIYLIFSLTLLLVFNFLKKIGIKKLTKLILIILILSGFFAWFNFGYFHRDGTFIHRWEHFHYFIGSKYFPELGYDGLYMASIAAKAENIKNYLHPELVRDLRNDKINKYKSLLNHQKEVVSRFSQNRWEKFKKDLNNIKITNETFLDHGYNPPPPFTFIVRFFTGYLPVNENTIFLLSLFDVIFLALCIIVIIYYFGLYKAACFSILLGIGFLSFFKWTGGAFFRYDWFLSLILCISMLKKKYFLAAGGFFAYSVCIRIFPILFFPALVIYWIKKKLNRECIFFVSAFFSVSFILCIGGLFNGRGVNAYFECYSNLKNLPIWNNGIGLRYLFTTSSENLKGSLVIPTVIRNV